MPFKGRRNPHRNLLIALFAVIGLLIVVDSMGRGWETQNESVTIIDLLATDSEAEFTSDCTEMFLSAGYDVEVMRAQGDVGAAGVVVSTTSAVSPPTSRVT